MRSFAIAATLLSLLMVAPMSMTAAKPANVHPNSKEEYLRQLRELFGSVTDQVKITDTDLSLSEETTGMTMAGTITAFGLHNVQLRATFGTERIDITTDFPAGAGAQPKGGRGDFSPGLFLPRPR